MARADKAAIQFVSITADVLNDIAAIVRLDLTAQATDGLFQGPGVVIFGIEPHDAGNFVVTEQAVMDKRFKYFHFDKRNFQLFTIAMNTHPVLIQHQATFVQACTFTEKGIEQTQLCFRRIFDYLDAIVRSRQVVLGFTQRGGKGHYNKYSAARVFVSGLSYYVKGLMAGGGCVNFYNDGAVISVDFFGVN